MRGTHRWGCRLGGAAAAFWLGFLCGGGGDPWGAATQAAAEARQDVPAVQPPAAPSSAAEEQPPAAPAEPEGPTVQPPAAPSSAAEEQPPDASAEPEPPVVQPPDASSSAADDQPADASAEPEMTPDAEPRPAPPPVQDRPREFTADVGVVLYFVRPEGESAFEETMARAAEALAADESEERRRQADGWSTWRAEETLADGVILYLSWLDPAVPGADYWIPGILNEAFPTEAQGLYETYAEAFADGQILLNLTPVAGP